MDAALAEFHSTPEGLLTLSDSGKAPPRRVADAASGYAIFKKMRDDDREANAKRAKVQAMLDGEPPWRQADLIETGQGARSNLNFDEAGALLEFAMSGYVDLFSSTEEFLRFKLRRNAFPVQQAMEYEAKISQHWTQMLRQWGSFYHRFLYCCHHFIANGVSVAYFPDHYDWRWQVAKFGDFFIPRHTQADPGALEMAGAEQKYLPSQLFRFIQNEQVAAAAGWNVPAVKKVLSKMVAQTSKQPELTNDWESIQERLKNNDTYYDATYGEVDIAHLWVREFGGAWSHYIMHDEGGCQEYLYEKPNKYPSNRPPFFFFTYGIGTNGYYHSIRGLGYKIFPHIQVSNRLRNQVIDSAMLTSSLLIQPADEQALQDLALTYYGPYAVLPPGNKVIERSVPNLQANALPVIQDMSGLLQGKTGQYSSVGMFADSKERTRFEVEAYVARVSKLSITSLNLFYEPFQALLREIARRTFAPAYGPDMPGGDFVRDLKDRLLEDGVPEEALSLIDFDRCTVVRAVGGGSPEARQLILNELAAEASSFDDVGRRNLLRDRLAAKVGYDMADRYAPASLEPRPTVDDKLAMLENEQLIAGASIPALQNEVHLTHLATHVSRIGQYFDAVEAGQIDLAEVVAPMVGLHAHATEHVELGGMDPAIMQQVAAYRQQLQQYGEMIWNGQKKLQALARERAKAEEQAQAQGGQPGEATVGGSPLPPELERKLIEHNLRLKMKTEEHEMKLRQREQEFLQKRVLADIEAARKISGPQPTIA
jgi:hypothetical protein